MDLNSLGTVVAICTGLTGATLGTLAFLRQARADRRQRHEAYIRAAWPALSNELHLALTDGILWNDSVTQSITSAGLFDALIAPFDSLRDRQEIIARYHWEFDRSLQSTLRRYFHSAHGLQRAVLRFNQAMEQLGKTYRPRQEEFYARFFDAANDPSPLSASEQQIFAMFPMEQPAWKHAARFVLAFEEMQPELREQRWFRRAQCTRLRRARPIRRYLKRLGRVREQLRRQIGYYDRAFEHTAHDG